MAKQQQVVGFEINHKFVGALLTEQVDGLLRVFCYYINGEISSFDLPAKDNIDNLRHFFTKLNMEETCSSLINDEVVQGRFYVRSEGEENCWLYTLLASPGNIMPVGNEQIFNLPWRVCWRSLEAEVLECGRMGEAGHCFAIRTMVTDGDASRLLKQSKAFLNPIVVQKKRSAKRLYAGVGIGLACLVLPMAVTLYCSHRAASHAVPPPVPVVVAAKAQPVAPPKGNYYLLSNHQITGPFSAKTIVEMKAAGRINDGTLCRAENSTEWAGLAAVLPASALQ
jgi:hypothetical protein